MEGDDFEWTTPSKNINKVSAHSGATPTCVKNNNAHSLFEEEDEEDTEEEEHEYNRKVDPSKETKVSFDEEDLSIEDIDEILREYNEKHPEDIPGAGVFKYASMLEKDITEKEKEIEECELKCCSNEALRS